MNTYGYVRGNPTQWVDPYGLVTLPGRGPISSGYGLRNISGRQEFHPAMDISNPVGGSVVSSDTGIVTRVRQNKKGKANSITIEHFDGTVSSYSHVKSGYKKGDIIHEAQVIGVTDLSGSSTGGHVHYEYFKPGERVNPAGHLKDADPYPFREPKKGESPCA